MATEGEERFLRSSHLLLKGTFYISKKVLVREAEIVHQQTGLNLDDLLKEKKVKLKHEFRNKRHREKLFPANGKTNVEDWDISLLTGVLLIVFQTSLPEEDRTAVKNIKYQRNEVYAHCAMASLDEVDYTDTCKYLKDAFNRLASGCGPEVKQECDAIIDTCLNGSLDHKSHVEHLKRLAEKDDLLLEILEKIETIGKNTTNDLKNTFKVENSALKIYITEDNSRRENNICDTIRNSKLTREEMRTVVLEALQQEKDGRQRKTIEVLDSQLDIYGRDEDEDKIALAEYIIVTVTNEALKRGNTSMEYTQIREIIQEILDEIVKQSGVKPLLAIKGSVIIRFESCSYEQLSRLIIYMESTDMTDRLNKLAGKLSRLMSTKEQLQVSFSFSLKTLENLLAEIETNNERECKKSVHIPILIESDEGKNRVLDLFKGGGLTNKLHKLSTALTETVGANINVKPSVSMEAFDDFDHEDIYEEIREPEEKPSDDEEDLYLTTEEPEEQDIQEEPSDKRGIDERLASAQKALLLQEETVCRNEQIVMSDKISCLERTVPAKESDQRQTQERIAKMRQQMERLECENKNLHNDLVKAEERCIRLELANKSAMDDLQRMTLTLKDNDTKHQVNAQHETKTALQLGSYEGKQDVVQFLLENKADVNMADGEGDTALHFAAFGQEEGCMEMLLKKGAKLDAQNKKGQTSLHITIGKGSVPCTRLLIKHCASVNIQDEDGDTPMHDCIVQKRKQNNLLDAVFRSRKPEFKLRNGRGFNVLQWAALKDCRKAAKYIITAQPSVIEEKMPEGFTALHICAANDHVEIASDLLAAKANKDATDGNGRTPLIVAVSQSHKRMVELLITYECKVNAQDSEGNTALHVAQISRALPDTLARLLGVPLVNDDTGLQISCMLVEARASVTIKNKQGMTPIDLCTNTATKEFLKRLSKTTADQKLETSKRGVLLPTHWDQMDKSVPLKRIELDTKNGLHQKEFQDVKNKFCRTLPQARIVKIERVQNKYLWEHYYLKRTHMESVHGKGCANELDLYHGTDPEKVDVICKDNLDHRLAGEKVGTLFGQGFYFASDAKYSDGYAVADKNGHKFMFQCRVLAGKWTYGDPKYKRPPPIDDKSTTRLYDCCVDSTDKPRIFCLFDMNQYYPEYVIEYK